MDQLKIMFEDELTGKDMDQITVIEGSMPVGLILKLTNERGDEKFMALSKTLKNMGSANNLPALKRKVKGYLNKERSSRLEKLVRVQNKTEKLSRIRKR